MTSSSSEAPAWHAIADVERDTGLSKDTLRVWERRYGFPTPTRDAQGERQYDNEQLLRLRHIRRLIDAGHRPGRVVAEMPVVLPGGVPGGAAAPRPAGFRTSADYAALCRQATEALERAMAP